MGKGAWGGSVEGRKGRMGIIGEQEGGWGVWEQKGGWAEEEEGWSMRGRRGGQTWERVVWGYCSGWQLLESVRGIWQSLDVQKEEGN